MLSRTRGPALRPRTKHPIDVDWGGLVIEFIHDEKFHDSYWWLTDNGDRRLVVEPEMAESLAKLLDFTAEYFDELYIPKEARHTDLTIEPEFVLWPDGRRTRQVVLKDAGIDVTRLTRTGCRRLSYALGLWLSLYLTHASIPTGENPK